MSHGGAQPVCFRLIEWVVLKPHLNTNPRFHLFSFFHQLKNVDVFVRRCLRDDL